MSRYCAECGDYCDGEEFSNNQWRKGDGYSRCIDCVEGGAAPVRSTARYCADCNNFREDYEYSNNQWNKGDGYSRCTDCVGRPCAECGRLCDSDDYSNIQWIKGSGTSRCMDCVNNAPVYYECGKCSRSFNTQNQLKMHMQVHRPRNVPCPVCGDTRFRSGANAAQHVESGYCTGCRGADNARAQIYKFAQQQRQMNQYMLPQLGNGGHGDKQGVPDFPYQCRPCSKKFRQMSQLLQHQDQKHNNRRAIEY